MASVYNNEVKRFRETFERFRDKKIVIYGIGRFSAVLLPGIRDFQVVGLMDRNPENIGRTMYGIPIISLEEAESIADIIIINTSPIYWNTIYRRIHSVKLPVFNLDGTEAQDKDVLEREFFFSGQTIDQAIQAINKHEIITFDFFDTLVLRKCWSKSDVFALTGLRGEKLLPRGTDFVRIRNEAASKLQGGNPTLIEIYTELGRMLALSDKKIYKLMALELSIERELLSPRHDVVKLLRMAIIQGKNVYIISDMYLSSKFIEDKLNEFGVKLPKNHIIVSCEYRGSKIDGSLWRMFRKKNKNQSILHIGDDEKADNIVPATKGIDTYRIPSVSYLADTCGLTDLAALACSLYSSVLLGHVLGKLLNSPFALQDSTDKLPVCSREGMGYALLGPVIVSYLIWLEHRKKIDNVHTLFFFSRDGYFLQKDFAFMESLLGRSAPGNSRYLCVSRFVSMLADADKSNDYENLLLLPYTAEPVNFLRKRFLLDVDCPKQFESEKDENAYKRRGFEKYEYEIRCKAHEVRLDYQEYLATQNINSDDAFVDLSYRGTNQHFIQKILGQKLPCYYLVADISDDNPYKKDQLMFTCAQENNDPTALHSDVYKYQLAIESFLTAPYGMILRVHGDGKLECDKPKLNQKYFHHKEEINEGVKKLLEDILIAYGMRVDLLRLDISFMVKLYGTFMQKAAFSREAVDSFFYDNGIFHDEENPVFT